MCKTRKNSCGFLQIHFWSRPGRSLSASTGWSVACLQDWGPFLKLAIPSMLMNCLEWWLYEIAGFLAGIISELELGAQSVVYQLAAVAYLVIASLLLSEFSFHGPKSKASKTPAYGGLFWGFFLTAVSLFSLSGFFLFPCSFQLVSLWLPVFELEMLWAPGARSRPSCQAKSPSSLHVWVNDLAWEPVFLSASKWLHLSNRFKSYFISLTRH